MNRPNREDYPLDMAGDLQFNRALVAWQYDEIERLTKENADIRRAAENVGGYALRLENELIKERAPVTVKARHE